MTSYHRTLGMALFTDEVQQQNARQELQQSKPSQPDAPHYSNMCTDMITWSNPSSPVWEEEKQKSFSSSSSSWANFSEEHSHAASGLAGEDGDWATFESDANSCSCDVPVSVVYKAPARRSSDLDLDFSGFEHTSRDHKEPQHLHGLVNGHCGSKSDSSAVEGGEKCAVTPEWQEFAFGEDVQPTQSETMYTELPPHQFESVNTFRTKPRSASMPTVVGASEVLLSDAASRQVLLDCFHTDVPPTAVESPLSTIHSAVDQRFWSALAVRACSPDPPSANTSTGTVIEERLVAAMRRDESCYSPRDVLDLGCSDQEDYDWTVGRDRDPDTVSLDLQPSLFRSKPDTPVYVEFDHSRAALGLSTLSADELGRMCDEMSSKCTNLSEELVEELQQRDFLVHQMELKNRFISTMLKVQNLRHAAATSVTAGSGGSNGGGGGGGGGGGEGGGRGRSWSMRSSVRTAMKHREEKASGKFLLSIIPYTPPDQLHWSVSTLQQLTKILQAIAEDSDTVPALVADYLQSEVLQSPIREKSPPPLQYSKSCDDSFSSRSSSREDT